MGRLEREIALALWKIHILHHAAEGPVYGQWISEELRRHGYVISPGTLYPLLARMEAQGWLSSHTAGTGAAKERRNYVLSAQGACALATLRVRVAELHRELGDPGGAAVSRRGRPRRPAREQAPLSSKRARPAARGGAAGGGTQRGPSGDRKETPR